MGIISDDTAASAGIFAPYALAAVEWDDTAADLVHDHDSIRILTAQLLRKANRIDTVIHKPSDENMVIGDTAASGHIG